MDKNGVTVPMGTPGEVWFKGYNVMPGYWNDEEMTKKTIVDDGWLRSGCVSPKRENSNETKSGGVLKFFC